jgi:hypothetical protein
MLTTYLAFASAEQSLPFSLVPQIPALALPRSEQHPTSNTGPLAKHSE